MVHNAVNEIADGSGAENRDADDDRIKLPVAHQPGQAEDGHDQKRSGNNIEKPLLPLEHTESSAGVFKVMKLQHVADENKWLISLQIFHGQIFCELIEQNQSCRKNNKKKR